MFRWLNKLESAQPFTEAEAWGLFRLAALSEAFGWTLLISGILIKHYHLLGSGVAVPIAGRIHGTIFLGYFAVLIAVYSSLHWPRKKFLVAVLAGIPPYGTLIFEQWAAHGRQTSRRRVFFLNVLLPIIAGKV